MSSSVVSPATRLRPAGLVGVVLGVAALGLLWAKWLPSTERTLGLLDTGRWKGTSVLLAGEGRNPFVRAWDFTVVYSLAVWKALAVALVVSASSTCWCHAAGWWALGRRSTVGGSVAGGLAALPAMMCPLLGPLALTMRRAGVPTSAALAFWLGNPVLNPAVLVFLALLARWPWLAVRVVLGLVLVVGVSTLLGTLASRRAARLPAADQAR